MRLYNVALMIFTKLCCYFQTMNHSVIINGIPINGMFNGFVNGISFAFNDTDMDDYDVCTYIMLQLLLSELMLQC